MSFNVGETVVHRIYGTGEIIQLEEKQLSGQNTLYYVLQVRDLTLWVPVEGADQQSLRRPSSVKEFQKYFEILRSPADILSTDRLERKAQLTGRLKDGSLNSVCQVIRDLNSQNNRKKLNDYEANILERARKFLLDEWTISLRVSLIDAQRELNLLLDGG